MRIVPPGPGEKRGSERAKLFISAMLEFAGRVTTVRVRNLSEGGAQIEGNNLPIQGDEVCISRGVLTANGVIVWARRNIAGIQFNTPLDLEAWLPRARAVDYDTAYSLLEQKEARKEQEHLSSLELHLRLAEELSFCARSLEHTGNQLAGNGFVLTKFSDELQSIVLIQHTLEEIGRVLSATDPDLATRKIQLGDLRRRLLRGDE